MGEKPEAEGQQRDRRGPDEQGRAQQDADGTEIHGIPDVPVRAAGDKSARRIERSGGAFAPNDEDRNATDSQRGARRDQQHTERPEPGRQRAKSRIEASNQRRQPEPKENKRDRYDDPAECDESPLGRTSSERTHQRVGRGIPVVPSQLQIIDRLLLVDRASLSGRVDLTQRVKAEPRIGLGRSLVPGNRSLDIFATPSPRR